MRLVARPLGQAPRKRVAAKGQHPGSRLLANGDEASTSTLYYVIWLLFFGV